MKVVLLAGGVSSRIWPLTRDKNLWPFFPYNLLTHNLKTLKEVGLTEIILVINPTSEAEAKKNTHHLDFPVEIVVQEKANGIGQALLLAEDKIKGSDLLVLNCDDVVGTDLIAEVIVKAGEKKTDLILSGKKVEKYFDGGYFKLEGSKAIGMVEKPGEGNQPSDLVKLVVDYYQDSSLLLQALRDVKTEKDDHYETALDKLMQTQTSEVISYTGDWLTIKYPWHLLDMTAFFFRDLKESQISDRADISPRAVIDGPVVIEEGVKIFENAKIKGPAFLGKNVVVANNALVRESYIGEDCVVGFASEVARSYLGKGCWTHNNFVGDSVLQGNVSFGVGTVLTNLKLDEGEISSVVKGNKINTGKVKFGAVIGENVRIGSNSTVMPGVKIGHDCFIGAGVVVKEDLEAGQFLYLTQQQVVKTNRQSLSSNNKAGKSKSREDFKGKL